MRPPSKVTTKAPCRPKSRSTQSQAFQHNFGNLSCIILTITNPVTSVVSPSKILRKCLKTARAYSSQFTVKHRIALEMTCSLRSSERANSRSLDKVRTRAAPSHLLKASSWSIECRRLARTLLSPPSSVPKLSSIHLRRPIGGAQATMGYRIFSSKSIWSPSSSPTSHNNNQVWKMIQEAESWARSPQIIRRDQNLDNERHIL